MIPIPVFDVFETPAKVSQLAMLEQRAAIRLLRTAHKVGRTVHFQVLWIEIAQPPAHHLS